MRYRHKNKPKAREFITLILGYFHSGWGKNWGKKSILRKCKPRKSSTHAVFQAFNMVEVTGLEPDQDRFK